ncbi:MAG: DNA polymerase III subunit delta' [Halocynthiibacter sp.]
MSDLDLPQADQLDAAPHPRETHVLLGQNKAETAFLDAYNSQRLHHGWLITGPRGVGKATLAWRIARFLLAQPVEQGGGMFDDVAPAPTDITISNDHPVSHRMLALSEPRLFLLRRRYDEKTKKFKQDITVDEVRKLKNFFAMSATDGGRRVVIVDAADEMNVNAANAILKLLEEPPEDAFLLLVSHQPSKLLPTIRSRCRELRCQTLATDTLMAALQNAGVDPEGNPAALNALAEGSAGRAVELLAQDGAQIYREIARIFASLPGHDREAAIQLAESAADRSQLGRFDLILDMMDLFLARLARSGARGHVGQDEATDGERDLFMRLAPDATAARAWANLQQELSARARRGKSVNLDPAALILDMFFKIETCASKLAAR